MASAPNLLALLSTALLVNTQLTTDPEYPGKITCFGWTGREYSNNTQCPGSNVCCQTSDLCNNNRFCIRDDEQLIVPACAYYPWSNCANICQYDPGTGFLPRAVECGDGSYCCDNDPNCCVENRGLFLNGLGSIVSATSSTGSITSASTTSSTSSTSSSTTDSTTASSTATSSGDAGAVSSSSSLSTGVKAGIAIGAVAAVLIIGLLAFFLFRSHNRLRAHNQGKQTPVPFSQSYTDANQPPPQEMGYQHDTPPKADRVQHRVHELGDKRASSPQVIHEMHS